MKDETVETKINENENETDSESENELQEKDNKVKKKISSERQRDILLRIASVLMAVTIWFIVIGFESPIIERKFTSVPVNHENVSVMEQQHSLSIINKKDITIDVVVSGKKSDVNKLKNADIYAYIDFQSTSIAGNLSFPIDVKIISNTVNGDNIEIIDRSSTNTIIYIDTKMVVPLTVRADIGPSMKELGVKLIPENLNPETITVSGPKGVIEKLSHAQVNINLSPYGKIERSLTVTENFSLIDLNGDVVTNQYIKTDPTNVEIYIAVTMIKEIPLKLNFKHGYYNDKNTIITVTPPSIQIEGSPDYLNMLNEISLSAIDEKAIDDDISLNISIPLPDGIKATNGVTTAEIDIKFIDTDTRIMTLPASNIKVVPPPNKLEYHIINESLQLKLRGATANLGSLRVSNIVAGIDLSKITEKGTQSVPVEVTVISDNSIFCVGTYTVNVEIY